MCYHCITIYSFEEQTSEEPNSQINTDHARILKAILSYVTFNVKNAFVEN